MPNDEKEPKPRTVRTASANVIRAIVLGAAAAAAPPGCDESAGSPPVDATTDDASAEGATDEASEDVAADDDGSIPDSVLPDDARDGVEPDIPDAREDLGEAAPAYGVPDGTGSEADAAGPDADADATVDYGVPDTGTEVVPPYGAPEYGVPDYGTPDYGVPDDPPRSR